jgi:transmembrane sensor
VTGTHFHVERAPGKRVAVGVDEGVVEVTSPGTTARRLGAGEQWSAPDGPVALEPAPSEAPPPEVVASSSRLQAPPPVPSGAAPAPPIAAAPELPSKSAGARATRVATGDATRDAANDLFQEAQRARAEGRVLDAARAFDKVRRSYRKDPHAAIAAFELGRLRLDVLEDPVGAEEALHDAVLLGPASPLREDAEARRVEALSRAGDRAGCAAARDAYLARWPSGTYRRTVELYCGP